MSASCPQILLTDELEDLQEIVVSHIWVECVISEGKFGINVWSLDWGKS